MKHELRLQLQTYLDGELPPGETPGVTKLLAQDAEARALYVELQNTRKALACFESEVKLPESREFYWSKIERELRRLEQPESVGQTASIFVGWRRFFAPVIVLAVAATAVMLVAPQLGNFSNTRPSETETALADSGAFTYRDYGSGTTLVWLSYPPENQFAESD